MSDTTRPTFRRELPGDTLNVDPDDDIGIEPEIPTITINARQTISLILYILGIVLMLLWVADRYPDFIQPVLGVVFIVTGALLGQE